MSGEKDGWGFAEIPGGSQVDIEERRGCKVFGVGIDSKAMWDKNRRYIGGEERVKRGGHWWVGSSDQGRVI